MFHKIIKLIGITTALLSGLLLIGSFVTGFHYENLRKNLDNARIIKSSLVEEGDLKQTNTEGPLSQMMQLNFP
jgi:hypothetical protein